MVQRCKFSIELKNFPPDLSGEPFVSQTGRLLVGTTHGLFIYQESAFRKVLFGSNALSSINFITGIVEGYKDTFWLTSQGGLIEYNIETGQS